jgi:hypothetical protein
MLDTSRFQDADKYSAYLKTPAGRLRSELAWENVRRFLPGNASECLALEVGGGTGFVSVRLARLRFEVVLLAYIYPRRGTKFVRSSRFGSRRRMWCSRVL